LRGRIFISYRREASAWPARALFERLRRSFPGRVFIDLESIQLGADFTRIIDAHLKGCHVMLAVLGPRWLAQLNERALREDDDFVRLELARALRRGIPVIPVLVDGADLPHAGDLPAELRALTKRNAVSVQADTFDAQLTRIESELRTVLAAAGEPVALPDSSASMDWMLVEGQDAHGRWADVRINGVTQRLRWIAPGDFWMGQTVAEFKRFYGDDAKDVDFDAISRWRRAVSIPHGFWLADTACTQALWTALVGKNPSGFLGDPELPVENVSWEDVNKVFLPALNRWFEDKGKVTAALPSEQQWEYACRAGSDFAYSFGEMLSTAQANYDGRHPPPGGEVGENRGRTLPVKALPANRWGLYQMHGNVREWCADTASRGEFRDEGQLASVRGGSWYEQARTARSAFRGFDGPTVRHVYNGFRWALLTASGAAAGKTAVASKPARPRKSARRSA
jgi:formylglycine-generating enzyme required for sulfatase activity